MTVGISAGDEEAAGFGSYREQVLRRAAAGQLSCAGGSLAVDDQWQRIGTGAVEVRSVDSARPVFWSSEQVGEASRLWIWNTDGGLLYDMPDEWRGEAPVSPFIPWLRMRRA